MCKVLSHCGILMRSQDSMIGVKHMMGSLPLQHSACIFFSFTPLLPGSLDLFYAWSVLTSVQHGGLYGEPSYLTFLAPLSLTFKCSQEMTVLSCPLVFSPSHTPFIWKVSLFPLTQPIIQDLWKQECNMHTHTHTHAHRYMHTHTHTHTGLWILDTKKQPKYQADKRKAKTNLQSCRWIWIIVSLFSLYWKQQ